MSETVKTDLKLLTVEQAAVLLNIGRTRAYEQVKLGRLRSVKLGSSRLIPSEALDDFVELLVSESAATRA